MRLLLLAFAATLGCNAIDGADGYKRVGGDAGSPDGDGVCATSCLETARTCLDTCNSDHASCVAACSNPGCTKGCDTTQSNCTSGCTSNCASCDVDCTVSGCANPPAADAGTD